jgi:hypothetical protein
MKLSIGFLDQCISKRWQGRSNGLDKRPVSLPIRSLADPFLQQGDFCGSETIVGRDWRHSNQVIV